MSNATGTVTPGNSWALEMDGSLLLTQAKLVQAATPSVSVPLANVIAAEDLQDDSVAARSLQDGIVGAIHLASDALGYLPKLTMTDQNNSNGTGQMTIQVQDANGTSLENRYFMRVWVSTADMAAAVASTAFTVSTGAAIQTITANADIVVLSTAAGLVVMAITVTGGGTRYVMAEIGGRVYSKRVIVTVV